MRFVICCLLFCFSSLGATEDAYDLILQEKKVAVPKDKVIQGNYYSLGDTVIEGTVMGSVYLVGGQLSVLGDVRGNLVVLGGSVFVGGKVLGNARIIAGQAIVEGVISGDVTFVGANLLLSGHSEIGGDLFIIAGNVALGDVVDGHVTAIASSFAISGTIKKNLKTFVDRLQISETGKVLGDLTYRSLNKASIDSSAVIGGITIYKPTLLRDLENLWFFRGVTVGSQMIPIFVKFFYTFVIGCMLITLFPHKLKKTLRALQRQPGRSCLYGMAVLMGLPILIALLLITVIGAPFALTLLALNIISFYTVTIFFILWLSNMVFRRLGWRENTILGLIVGQVIYYFLTMIPLLGILIACAATIFGFGATIVAQAKKT
ncbi:MAG: polymer-forming cytoskeletal protein [Chlamydiota bacterium]